MIKKNKKKGDNMTQEDIPKRVILVLLILTIVISVLGTWTVLDAASSARPMVTKDKSGGQVSLTIIDPNKPLAEPIESNDQGQVNLNIIK